MPKRFLKPGLTTSERWNACSFEAQSFYVRLITLVDDYGRYDGRLQVLKSHAFPLSDKLTSDKVEKLCAELAEHDLATFYVAEDKRVVQLQRWEEKPRSEPKFPAIDSNCEQLFADVSKCSPRARALPSSSSSNTTTDAGELVLDFPQNLRTTSFSAKWDMWVSYRKGRGKSKDWGTMFKEQLVFLGKYSEDTAIGILSASMRNGWQGLFEPKEQKNGHRNGNTQALIPGTFNP